MIGKFQPSKREALHNAIWVCFATRSVLCCENFRKLFLLLVVRLDQQDVIRGFADYARESTLTSDENLATAEEMLLLSSR